MPIYIYKNDTTGEVKEVFQGMKDEHIYEEDGIKWSRVFVNPNALVDTFNSLDPFDKNAFIKRTAKVGMNVGEMWDESKKLSEKRAKSVGQDYVKLNAQNKYKTLTGKDHPEAPKPKNKFIK